MYVLLWGWSSQAPNNDCHCRLLAVSPDVAEFLEVVTLWDQSEIYTTLPWLQYGKGLSVWYISCDLDILGKVMRKRERFTVDVPSAGDRRVADICLTLLTSAPRSTSPFSAASGYIALARTAQKIPLPTVLLLRPRDWCESLTGVSHCLAVDVCIVIP
jgi:hypothetical protein